MQKRLLTIGGGAVLLFGFTILSSAEDKIQVFVNPKGKIIFTNLVDNTPASATAVEEVEVLTDEIPAPLKSLVNAISRNHGVDPGLVRAIMKTESNFNRWAVSPKGALGLMQLMPQTGQRLGVRDFFDPQQNIEAGVRHLRSLLDRFNGDLDLSLAAYNAGENLVERIGRIPSIPETRDYVRKIRTIYTKKSAPAAPAAAAISAAATTNPVEKPKDEAPRIFRTVDERGVVRFSNIEPPN